MMCDEIDGDFKIMKHLKGGLRLLSENYLANSCIQTIRDLYELAETDSLIR